MNPFWLILALILVLIYVLSPIDGVPDVIPILGWLDDSVLVGLLIYFLRYGRLPGFLSWINRLLFKNNGTGQETRTGASVGQEQSGSGTRKVPADPYEILGIAPGASREQIHAAYRAAVQQYHPDKVAHLGVELQELARKKFVEIQAAYEFLMKETA
ncbi:MAG: hypothetical protein COX19_10520 [Desulfobacterales bacterium CG23_combo_of_CG06-09_8_20_14_all_51_8]|nr:MAG: hypothetical protein COX19_10520 [Desulfobacterales bacterium CG23_combo_of_CG06-09_8_20_14_all_51_8]